MATQKLITLSTKKVDKALSDRSVAKLINHLEETALSEEDLQKLGRILKRYGPLLCKYPNPPAEEFRTSLFDSLDRYVQSRNGNDDAAQFEAIEELILQCESGYRRILTLMESDPAYQLAPDVRIWAVLKGIGDIYQDFAAESYQQWGQREFISHFPILSRNEDGSHSNPDGVVGSLVEMATMNLLMEAWKNKWFDKQGLVVLPVEPAISTTQLEQAASAAMLAQMWRRWERTEERRRFLGGKLEVLTGSQLPADAPPPFDTVIRYVPEDNGPEFVDYVANERLSDWLRQNYHLVLRTRKQADRPFNVAEERELPPKDRISEKEAHAGIMLCEMLAYNILKDATRYGGLLLSEWLRGYATLQCLAGEPDSPGPMLIRMDAEELVAILRRMGLKGSIAETFLERASLRRNSRDLFDQPLVRCADNHYLLFAPAISSALLPRVILTSIASSGIQLAKKGKAHEQRLLDRFTTHKLVAKAVKATRDGQEYDYDVALLWDDYIFLFECKNYGLSGTDPQQAAHFYQSVHDHVKQMKRLVRGCQTYPDILSNAFGIDSRQKTIVPCVVNALAYAIPGGIDGIYFLDASALGRFFSSAEIKAEIGDGVTVIRSKTVARLWEGNAPTPHDLIKQLRNPVQFQNVATQTRLMDSSFPLDNTTEVWTQEYGRNEVDLAALFNVDDFGDDNASTSPGLSDNQRA